jgi:hypothetical protein
MGLSMQLVIKSELVQRLAHFFGDKSGDIPVYSLHRIKNMLRKNPINITGQLQKVLIEELLLQNKEYKQESGNDWSCLTSQNLVDAIEGIDKRIQCVIEQAQNCPDEMAKVVKAITEKLLETKDMDVAKIKNWFFENYDDLLYACDGKIPWPIIRRLRSDLSLWIIRNVNPFEKDIEEMILEVAGEKFETAEDAWVAMGGTIFTKKE